MGLSRLVARNYLHARFNLEIWSETIPLACMMKFVRHLIAWMKLFWDFDHVDTGFTLEPMERVVCSSRVA